MRCTVCAHAHRHQKRELGPPDFRQLWAWVLCKNRNCSSLLSHLSSPCSWRGVGGADRDRERQRWREEEFFNKWLTVLFPVFCNFYFRKFIVLIYMVCMSQNIRVFFPKKYKVVYVHIWRSSEVRKAT